jgi:hypothetical protein
MADSCATCFNYRQNLCRAGLPQIIPDHGSGTFWPKTEPTDWCANFTLTGNLGSFSFTTGTASPSGGNNGDWYLQTGVSAAGSHTNAIFWQKQSGSWVNVLQVIAQ